MRYGLGKHYRRSLRLRGNDYSQVRAYFMTNCTRDRKCLFGDAVNGQVRLNDFGRIAEQSWLEISMHFSYLAFDTFVVMSNHIHGIVVGAWHAVPLRQWHEHFGESVSGSIATIIRSFKSAITKLVNELGGMPGMPVWQPGYYEHISPDESSLNRIRQYILDNPMRWQVGRENSQAVEPEPVEGWRGMNSFPDLTVESGALGWLESLGWAVKHGSEIAPGELFAERQDYREVALVRWLLDVLLPKLIAGEIHQMFWRSFEKKFVA